VPKGSRSKQKKKKNWDNFLPKGMPCPLAQSAVGTGTFSNRKYYYRKYFSLKKNFSFFRPAKKLGQFSAQREALRYPQFF
jgi:hypothetical protein